MFRFFYAIVGLVLFAVVLGAAEESIELKDYTPKVGDRIRVTEEERTDTRSVAHLPETVEDKTEKRVKVIIYTSETLAVKDGAKKPTKLKRVYEKAEESKDGNITKLPLDGKTITIEKKGDKYTFLYADGKAVDGNARELLDKEFNNKEDDIGDLIPKRPLKAGESWKMNAEKLRKKHVLDTFASDEKGSVSTGKLLEIYSFDGHKYGVFDLDLSFPLTELKGTPSVPLKSGSTLKMRAFVDGNVDGSEPDGKTTVQISLRMSFDAPNGNKVSIRADGLITHVVKRIPARPRD